VYLPIWKKSTGLIGADVANIFDVSPCREQIFLILFALFFIISAAVSLRITQKAIEICTVFITFKILQDFDYPYSLHIRNYSLFEVFARTGNE
jgi:hypothetical protein